MSKMRHAVNLNSHVTIAVQTSSDAPSTNETAEPMIDAPPEKTGCLVVIEKFAQSRSSEFGGFVHGV